MIGTIIYNIFVMLFLISICILLVFIWKDVIYLKKGSCANVPPFTGDNTIFDKDINIPFIGTVGAKLSFNKNGTFIVVGHRDPDSDPSKGHDSSMTFPNNNWIYLKESCTLAVQLDPDLLVEIQKAPVKIDIDKSLYFDENSALTIKFTISGFLSQELTVPMKK
jgi:hypothetical protein